MFTKEEKENYQKRYLDLCELTFRNNHSFNITTLTIVFQVNNPIDIQKLYSVIDDDTLNKQMAKNSDDFRMTKRRKVIQVFFNQLSLSFEDWSKKVIKIFANGKVHITGIASLYDFDNACDVVMSLLRTKLSKSYDTIGGKTKVVMINCTIDCGHALSLHTLCDQQTSKNGMCPHQKITAVSYCPERYPAVKVKMERSSAFLFRTGKIIITTNSMENMMNMYQALHLEKGSVRHQKLATEHYCGYGLKAITNCLM